MLKGTKMKRKIMSKLLDWKRNSNGKTAALRALNGKAMAESRGLANPKLLEAILLEELAKEYEGQIVIYKVDIDKERGITQAFNVSSVPSVLFIPGDDAAPVMTVGARDKSTFKKEIDTILLGK